MSLQELSRVEVLHDIRRFRTRVVTHGSLGRIVALCADRTDPTYIVEFSPQGGAGATVVLAGLNDHDVRLRDDAGPLVRGRTWQHLGTPFPSGCSALAPSAASVP